MGVGNFGTGTAGVGSFGAGTVGSFGADARGVGTATVGSFGVGTGSVGTFGAGTFGVLPVPPATAPTVAWALPDALPAVALTPLAAEPTVA